MDSSAYKSDRNPRNRRYHICPYCARDYLKHEGCECAAVAMRKQTQRDKDGYQSKK